MDTVEKIALVDYLNSKEKITHMPINYFSIIIEYLRKHNYCISEKILSSPRNNEDFNTFKLIVLDQEKQNSCIVFTFFNSIDMERTIEWIFDETLKIICFKGNTKASDIV